MSASRTCASFVVYQGNDTHTSVLIVEGAGKTNTLTQQEICITQTVIDNFNVCPPQVRNLPNITANAYDCVSVGVFYYYKINPSLCGPYFDGYPNITNPDFNGNTTIPKGEVICDQYFSGANCEVVE